MVRIACYRRRIRPALIALACIGAGLGIAGCGGGGGGGDNAAAVQPAVSRPAPAPALSMSATPQTVAAGGTAELRWSSSGAEHCEAAGAWDGARATGGSFTTGPIRTATDFRLSCSGPGGSTSRKVTVQVAGEAELDVDLKVSRLRVGRSDTVQVSWSARGATSCTASGGWSGRRGLSGRLRSAPLRDSTTFNLACTNGLENELASVSVEVLSKVLAWQPPSRNVDGSPLKDLAGYVVYWGKNSRQYTGSHRIHSAKATRWVAKIPPGVYRFALTAIDKRGNESAYSNEIEKVIP